MFTSMSDIGFSSKNSIIAKELREKMTDTSNNWKVRTETIDEMLKIIEEKIESEPTLISA